jgi:hypothetical protein
MSDETTIDLFAEDRAHEEFLKAVIHRLAREENKRVRLRLRSARGGHGKALSELKFYQRTALSGALMNSRVPDVFIVAIDANCRSFNIAHREIEENIQSNWRGRAVIACPIPTLSDGTLLTRQHLRG